MHFLPQNPKKRQLALVIIGVVVTLLLFGFLYVTYFSSTDSSGGSGTGSSSKIKAVSDEMIRKLQSDVAGIQDELDNDFYKNLKGYSWPKDTASPGNANPFLPPAGAQ